ncbi:hypothetical protein OCU04_009508 [Sclerotinia nivalis]|uniref:PHD-type domain-containing protein n=1 Tax=Sclerotinia nivalis TaxID=352851 RepID=A0A9X0AIS0_9HELO|nr:hypothetical protein OCU04_009508 [Sclerotinia nivalis]
MTERSLSISTQSATSIKPIFATTSTAISTHDVQFVTEPVDDEPYTIRCICNICEDDGNTIYCDRCETWQHIECYYSGSVEDASREDFDHLCVDCFPRDLGRHAIEKQQYRQNKVNYDNNDKKIKRPTTKSHKKKTKPSEIQTNGFNDQETHKNAGSLDNHTHKRAKGHRSHHSVSSQVTKRSPPYPARSNNHPPSPSHTSSNLPNDFHIHGYSKVFQSLYDDQLQETNDNTLANLSVTNKLAMWKTDAKQFEEDVGKKFDDVVQKTKVRLDPQQFPKLHVDVKTALINNNAKAQWKSLYTTTKTPGNQPIGEINGQIGLQSDYHKNPDNGWEECPHPRPLTFFIPGLPLYIDTRGGGSQCRYIRRSCRANANLETYIVANTSEYHFYLTLDSALSPDEQITLPWDFKFVDKPRLDRALHLDGDDDDRLPDISETEYQSMAHSINLVLSDHGGCACNAGKDCAFVRFHRDYYGRVHGQPQPQSNGVNGVKSKKGRKPKQHVSPTSTGHATNSRAASEGHPEANDDDDTRSTSGSGRSKPHSRDLTPIHGLGEVDTPSTEPSDREKRKLVALENTFRKMEQAPPRKKKRASDGSNMNSPVTTMTSQTNSKPRQKSVVSRTSVSQSALANFNGSRSRQYVDASTSRRQSASPPSAASPQAMASPKPIPSRDDSATSRSRHSSVAQKIIFVYTDSSAQTDRDEDAWYEQKTKPTPKKPVLSLARRMLLKRHKIHEQAQALAAEQNKNMAAGSINGDLQNISSPASAMDVDGPVQEDRSITQSPTDTRARNASIVSSTPSVDVISNSGDYYTDGSPLITGQTMKPPPWPGQSTNGYSHKSPELRVQMPPTPTFITPNLSGTPGALTPASAATSSAMSPYGTTHFSSYPTTLANGVNPSPAKKKMSLNDYKARKKQNADGSGGRKPSTGSSPTMPPAVLKSTLSAIEEAKARGILLDSKSDIIEGKEIVDPSPVDLLKVSPPKNNMPSQHSNGAL